MKRIILAFALFVTLAINLSAQTFTTLYSFTGGSDGASPIGDLILSGNTLYGRTLISASGRYGTLYKVNADGTGFTAFYSFAFITSILNLDYAGLILSGDTLYGTTRWSGSTGGTVFAVNTNGAAFTVIHNFAPLDPNTFPISGGANPLGGVIISGNTLYGTTDIGGGFNNGTVFKVNTDGSGFITLYNFTAAPNPDIGTNADGARPVAGLILSGNTLYGTTPYGGISGNGTIFKVNTDGSSFIVLHSFTGGGYGGGPQASLILSGNTLYGTAGGGNFTNGTIFKVNTDGSGFTTLHSFTASGFNSSLEVYTNSDGAGPMAGLILSGNTLYGTAAGGGSSASGTIFKVNTNGSGFTTLYNFMATSGSNSTNSDGAYPQAGLILSGNTLYGTTEYGGNSGDGTVFALNLAPSAPIITAQPQSQTAPIGSNVTFTVVASEYPPPNYQWLFKGQNILNATNATLTLNSVTAANDGGYSVVVSNPYGSVTSATASLAVLTDGANGNTPTQLNAILAPSKSAGVKNLVFITHGWQPGITEPPTPQWIYDMSNAIQAKVSSDWQIVSYSWIDQAWTQLPDDALLNAKYLGIQLGQQFAARGYQNVHLIAHSAASELIQEIANQLKSSPNPPTIQLTFLDPYVGAFLEEQNVYGENADWSDCYFVQDGSGQFTSGNLTLAFNVDVSWVDPAHTAAFYIGFGRGEAALSSHGYPYEFYIQSIVNTDPNWCAVGYGFALSEEMEGSLWNENQTDIPVGSGPFLPCSPPDAVQNPNSDLTALEAGITGVPTDISDAYHAVSDYGASVVGETGFLLQSALSSLPLVKSGGIQPMDETNSTDTPAWLAVGVSVTNAVNFVQFDAAFTDTNSAQGLLTVYWNTNQIGMVDERVAETNLQTYRFELPGAVSGGLYTLSFRLDSFASSSSIAVTNVATGFVGVTQPINLGISITNGAPLLQLTAATNFTYLVQSSTNLVDWTPTALLLNTNGTAQFMDSAVTNSGARFYRAVMP
jgi:uncharacterized repeat protein (TIGR03803 family)